MLGRLVTRWEDIVGPELSDKTQPVKIRYIKRKTKGEKPSASLDIATTSADATLLHYQKDLILERINQIFGDSWINSIRFVPYAANAVQTAPKLKKRQKPLTPREKQNLSSVLETIEDPDLREKLQSLGTAILQDRQS